MGLTLSFSSLISRGVGPIQNCNTSIYYAGFLPGLAHAPRGGVLAARQRGDVAGGHAGARAARDAAAGGPRGVHIRAAVGGAARAARERLRHDEDAVGAGAF